MTDCDCKKKKKPKKTKKKRTDVFLSQAVKFSEPHIQEGASLFLVLYGNKTETADNNVCGFV